MFTQLYSPKYTQPIKAYNSLLNNNIHIFKVNDHLYHNIQISVSYIQTYSFDINIMSSNSSSL